MDSLSSGMEKVVRKLVWSKGILLLVRDADSTFNWFFLLEFYLVASQTVVCGK